jgi:endonuclease YncB( thermonuclease family)
MLALLCLTCGRPERRTPVEPQPTELLRGTVFAINDGDTLTILDSSRAEHRIRLAAIDAPERGQPFARSARESLSSMALGKVANVEWSGRDRYGRIVGKVMLPDPACATRTCPDNFDAGLAQLRGGMAWWYRRYADEQSADDRRAYEEAEREAREQRSGLFSEPAPVPPWDWRGEQAAK